MSNSTSKERYVLYMGGLGDGYNPLRQIIMLMWNLRSHISAELVPMRWASDESFDDKRRRVIEHLEAVPKDAMITLVGESAAGALVISLIPEYAERIDRFVTICGKNRRPFDLSPILAEKNVALRQAIVASDQAIASMSDQTKSKLSVMYSTLDPVIDRRNTYVDGSHEFVRAIPGHLVSIGVFALCHTSYILRDNVS